MNYDVRSQWSRTAPVSARAGSEPANKRSAPTAAVGPRAARVPVNKLSEVKRVREMAGGAVAVRSVDSLEVGCWNVRSLLAEGRLELLVRALGRERVGLCALSETRWREEEVREVSDCDTGARWRCWFGAAEGGLGGVGVAVSERLAGAVSGWEGVSERLGVLRLEAVPLGLSLVVAYAPVEGAERVRKEEFYEMLAEIVRGERRKGRVVMVLGDLNARVGRASVVERDVLGRWGVGDRNENGELRLALLTGVAWLLRGRSFGRGGAGS